MASWNNRISGMEGNHLQSARPYMPSSMCSDLESMLVDMILNEIQNHISRIEDENERVRQQSLRASNTPDYSWLMDWKLKNKKMLSFRECSTVELLCQKLRRSEWGQVIKEWRTRAQFVDDRDGVVSVFRSVVDEVVVGRATPLLVSQVDETADQTWPTASSEALRRLSVVELAHPASVKDCDTLHNVV